MIVPTKAKTKPKVPPEARMIGANMRDIRRAQAYSRAEIARLLGVSHQQIQKYESGQNRLPLEKLCVLRAHYDVPYRAFFKGLETATEEEGLSERLAQLTEIRLRQKIQAIARILMQ